MKNDFIKFMKQSTTAFHAVAEIAKRLEEAGFEKIKEADVWTVTEGDKKYVVRNDSSLIAFSVPKKLETLRKSGDVCGFHMVCALCKYWLSVIIASLSLELYRTA